MKSVLKSLLLVILSLTALKCSTPATSSDIDHVFPKIDDNEYLDLIEENTRKDKRYSGLYNLYQVQATMLNTKVRLATLNKTASYLQWDTAKAREEREKVFQENSSETRFFLSFFSPEKDHNDLDKGVSIWKIYLDHNGSRYTGKVKKLNTKQSQLKTTYPHYTNFETAYQVVFPVPMTVIEEGHSQLVLTSSLGTTQLKY